MSDSRRRHVERLALACVLVVAACSGSSSSTGTTTTTSTVRVLLPAETPTGQVSLTGDTAVTGAAGHLTIRCGFPNLKGISIALLGKAYDTTTDLRVTVRAGSVTVQLSKGTGADYHERAFDGTGVSGFDAAKGATIDSPVTETPATAGTTPGAVPAIASINGSVDCRGQKPGSSTLTLSGDTAEGSLSGTALSDVRVECNTDSLGQEAVVSGILVLGAAKAFVSIGLRVDGVNVFELLDSGTQHRFQAQAGSAAPTSTGGHASGDAVEQNATPPHTIHIEGDVTCGSPP